MLTPSQTPTPFTATLLQGILSLAMITSFLPIHCSAHYNLVSPPALQWRYIPNEVTYYLHVAKSD